MRSKRLSLVFLGVFLVCLLAVPSVSAADFSNYTLTQTGITGAWDTASYASGTSGSFEHDTAGEVATGRANYTVNQAITIANETGGLWGLKFHIDHVTGNRAQWYWLNGVMRFYIAVDVQKGNEHLYALFYVAHEQGVLLQTDQTKVGNQGKEVKPFNIAGTYGDFRNDPLNPIISMPISYSFSNSAVNQTWTIQFQRLNSTQTSILYSSLGRVLAPSYFVYQNYARHNETYTNTADFWTGATAKIYVGYDGVGDFKVDFEDMQTVESPSIFYVDGPPSGQDDDGDGVPNADTDFFTQVVNFLIGLWSLIVQVVNIGLTFFLQFWQLIPLIGLFYLLDIAITTAQTGNLQLIGNAFSKLWEIILSAYDAIVAFGQLIWNTIDTVLDIIFPWK